MDKERRRRANGEGSIYRRASDNRWVGSAYVYTATGQRKRRPVYGASFDEVRQKLDKLKGNSANGVLVPDRSTSLRGYLEYWLREIASHRRAPKAKPAAKPSAASSATSHARSTRSLPLHRKHSRQGLDIQGHQRLSDCPVPPSVPNSSSASRPDHSPLRPAILVASSPGLGLRCPHRLRGLIQEYAQVVPHG
jgi:hypothetical protein